MNFVEKERKPKAENFYFHPGIVLKSNALRTKSLRLQRGVFPDECRALCIKMLKARTTVLATSILRESTLGFDCVTGIKPYPSGTLLLASVVEGTSMFQAGYKPHPKLPDTNIAVMNYFAETYLDANGLPLDSTRRVYKSGERDDLCAFNEQLGQRLPTAIDTRATLSRLLNRRGYGSLDPVCFKEIVDTPVVGVDLNEQTMHKDFVRRLLKAKSLR